MLMTLGLFVFSINTLSYQSLQRTTSWRHSSQNRIGNTPSYQYTGPGEDNQTLSGWIAPELAGDALPINKLRDMANTGEPYVIVDGKGTVHGLWVIKKISETKTLFYPNGEAKRIEFSINLAHVGDDRISDVSLVTNVLSLLA